MRATEGSDLEGFGGVVSPAQAALVSPPTGMRTSAPTACYAQARISQQGAAVGDNTAARLTMMRQSPSRMGAGPGGPRPAPVRVAPATVVTPGQAEATLERGGSSPTMEVELSRTGVELKKPTPHWRQARPSGQQFGEGALEAAAAKTWHGPDAKLAPVVDSPESPENPISAARLQGASPSPTGSRDGSPSPSERRAIGRPEDAFVDLNAARASTPSRPRSEGRPRSRELQGVQAQEQAASRPLTPSTSARRLFSLKGNSQAAAAEANAATIARADSVPPARAGPGTDQGVTSYLRQRSLTPSDSQRLSTASQSSATTGQPNNAKHELSQTERGESPETERAVTRAEPSSMAVALGLAPPPKPTAVATEGRPTLAVEIPGAAVETPGQVHLLFDPTPQANSPQSRLVANSPQSRLVANSPQSRLVARDGEQVSEAPPGEGACRMPTASPDRLARRVRVSAAAAAASTDPSTGTLAGLRTHGSHGKLNGQKAKAGGGAPALGLAAMRPGGLKGLSASLKWKGANKKIAFAAAVATPIKAPPPPLGLWDTVKKHHTLVAAFSTPPPGDHAQLRDAQLVQVFFNTLFVQLAVVQVFAARMTNSVTALSTEQWLLAGTLSAFCCAAGTMACKLTFRWGNINRRRYHKGPPRYKEFYLWLRKELQEHAFRSMVAALWYEYRTRDTVRAPKQAIKRNHVVLRGYASWILNVGAAVTSAIFCLIYGVEFQVPKFMTTIYSWLVAAGEMFLFVEPIIILAVFATPRFIDWAMLPREPKDGGWQPKIEAIRKAVDLKDLKGSKKGKARQLLPGIASKRSKAPAPRSPEVCLPGSPEMRRGKLSLAGASRKSLTAS